MRRGAASQSQNVGSYFYLRGLAFSFCCSTFYFLLHELDAVRSVASRCNGPQGLGKGLQSGARASRPCVKAFSGGGNVTEPNLGLPTRAQ